MSLLAPQFSPASVMANYLNGFSASPSGGLRVSRLLHQDGSHDADFGCLLVVREVFQEHRAPEIAEEIEDLYRNVQDRFERSGSKPSVLWAGSWRITRAFKDHVVAEGAGGKLVEILSRPEELTLRVGYASRQSSEELQARFSLSITRCGSEPQLRCCHDIGFGERSFEGLLQFLGLDLGVERLEWINRELLWRALRQRLETDGFQACRYQGDHLGLRWEALGPEGDAVSGAFWAFDHYPSLQFYSASVASPMAASFVPLWNEVVGRIRSSERFVPRADLSPQRPHLRRSVRGMQEESIRM